MEERIVTETELENILRRSRFTDKDHKRKLYGQIFGEKQSARESDDVRMPVLSLNELELVAGGKAVIPEVRESRADDQ